MSPALASRCTARSKTTGEQCRQKIIGGGVCRYHGGAAPRVAAAREVRAQLLRSRAYGAVEERSPADALLASSASLDATLQRLEALAGEKGGADPALLREIRSAASESARVAKLVQDAGLDERRQSLAERDQVDIGRVLTLALAAFGVEPGDAVVRSAVAEAAERVRTGDTRPLASRVVEVPQIEAPAPVEGVLEP